MFEKKPFLTAAETIAALGISKQTLYTYVSRGRLRGRSDPADPRRRLYDARDIDSILEVKARGRARKKIAQSTIQWGEPILRSGLTNIADERFYYRGRDAVHLSETASLEDIACLLWDVTTLPAVRLSYVRAARGKTPMERSLRAMADAAAQASPAKDAIAEAALLLKIMTRETAGVSLAGNDPVHVRLARAWRLKGEDADLLRRALVLCADHELNASAYAVRVVASTGASLAAALLAGLAALSGPLHGGMTSRVAAFMADPRMRRDPQKTLGKIFAERKWVPGFGHRLYPNGDPRMALFEAARPSAEWRRFVEAGMSLTGQGGTLDVALGHLQEKLKLPDGGGLGIFALGRTVGWIAHALEQRRDGTLIRPRAEFKEKG